MKQIKKSEKILKALANTKRLQILHLLDKSKELDIISITKVINLHYKTTAKHLDQLSAAGLIIKVRKGTWVKIIPNPRVKKLLVFIDNLDRRER